MMDSTVENSSRAFCADTTKKEAVLVFFIHAAVSLEPRTGDR